MVQAANLEMGEYLQPKKPPVSIKWFRQSLHFILSVTVVEWTVKQIPFRGLILRSLFHERTNNQPTAVSLSKNHVRAQDFVVLVSAIFRVRPHTETPMSNNSSDDCRSP